MLGPRAVLYNVLLVLNSATGTETLFHGQATAPTSIPAPFLDGKGVGAEAETGPGHPMEFIRRLILNLIDSVHGVVRVDSVIPHIPTAT